MRIQGVVDSQGLHFSFGFIVSQEGRVFVSFENVPFDQAGRQWLQGGEEVEFEIVNGAGRRFATNVKILSERQPVNLRTYREVGQVDKVGPAKDYAFFKRGFFGSNVFLHFRNRATVSPLRFAVGQFWEYGLQEPEEGKDAWLATNAEFVPSEELYPTEISQ
jgi:cold shock CspA family protein